MEPTTYRIPECNFAGLVDKINKLGRRAVKLGLTPPALDAVWTEDVQLIRMIGVGSDQESREWPDVTKPIPQGYAPSGYRSYIHVQITGEAPTLPGWDLLAVVEHGDSEVGNVVRTVPGRELPTYYRTAENLCQHCNTSRRRLETFVLREQATGTLKQVGRNCLADFCRDAKAAQDMVSAAEYLTSAHDFATSAEEGGWGGSRGPTRVSAEGILALTARIIRHSGWLSRTKAREDEYGPAATADTVREIVFSPRFWTPSRSDTDVIRALREAARDLQEQDADLGAKALEWARGLRAQVDTLSDYEHNLLVVLTAELVEEKHLGIACSAVAAYQRTVRVEQERAARPDRKHVGTVGERLEMELKVLGIHVFESQFGARVMYRMEDKEGNTVVWWTSATTAGDLHDQKTYRVKATVKAHTTYKEVPQTNVSRLKVVGLVTA